MAKEVMLKYNGRASGPDSGGGLELHADAGGRWVKGEVKALDKEMAEFIMGVYNRGAEDVKPWFSVVKEEAEADSQSNTAASTAAPEKESK